MKTEIIPYFGFDKIKFGLTLGQTELLLGKSSENNKESYSDNSSDVILKYHNLGFNLTFSSDNDFRLGTITFYSKDFEHISEDAFMTVLVMCYNADKVNEKTGVGSPTILSVKNITYSLFVKTINFQLQINEDV